MAELSEVSTGKGWKSWTKHKYVLVFFAVSSLAIIGCSSGTDVSSGSSNSSSSETLRTSGVETTAQLTTVVEQTTTSTVVVKKPPSTTLKMQESEVLSNAWESHAGTEVDPCKVRFIAGDMSGEGADKFLEQWNEAVREFNDRKLLVDVKEVSAQEKVAVVLHFKSTEPGDNLLVDTTGTHAGFLNDEGPIHIVINSDKFAEFVGDNAELREKLGRHVSFEAMFQILSDATPYKTISAGDFYLKLNLAGGNLQPGGYFGGLFNNLEKFGKLGCQHPSP